MRDGLYEGDYNEPDFKITGIYTRESFLLFADKLNIQRKLTEKIIDELTTKETAVKEFIQQSFLSDEGKSTYFKHFTDRQKRLCRN